MLNLDPGKLLVISVIGLMLIGPERVPRVARQLGTAWRTLTNYREQAEAELRKAMPDLDLPRIPRNPSLAVSTFLTGLTTSAGPVTVEERAGESGAVPNRSLPLIADAERLTELVRPVIEGGESSPDTPASAISVGRIDSPDMN